jgi:hypothetical protein
LIPDSSNAWESILARVGAIEDGSAVGSYLEVLKVSSLALVKAIFTVANLENWRFWVFLYLAICVSSNIRLSPADIKGSLSGIGCVVLPFILVNLIGLLTGLGGERIFPVTASSLGAVYSVMILALVLAIIGFIVIYLFSAGYYWVKWRRMLSPFG